MPPAHRLPIRRIASRAATTSPSLFGLAASTPKTPFQSAASAPARTVSQSINCLVGSSILQQRRALSVSRPRYEERMDPESEARFATLSNGDSHQRRSDAPPQGAPRKSDIDFAADRARSVFVGNIPSDVTEEELREIFNEHANVVQVIQGNAGK